MPEGGAARETTSFQARLLRRLRRTTASGELIAGVDGLRGLLLTAVIVHHITASYLRVTGRFGALDLPAQWWDVFPKSRVIEIGYAAHFALPLFFVISGFVLALPFVRSYRDGTTRPHLGSYYLRRLVRIEPPYVINITLAFLLIVLANAGWRAFIPHVPATLLYLHGPIFGKASWVNGVAWSLEVEIQFYIVMPLLATVLAVTSAAARRTLLVASIFVLAIMAKQLIHVNATPRLHLSLLNHLHFFLAGFLLADLYHAHGERGFGRSWLGDVLTAVAGIAIYVILTRRYDLYYLTPLLSVALYIGFFLGRLGYACITQRWLVVLGGMCYTVYLYHFMIIDLLAPWTMRLASPERALAADFTLQCVLLMPPIVLLSTALFLLIEQPFMNLSRAVGRYFQAQRAGSSPPAGVKIRVPFGRARDKSDSPSNDGVRRPG